MGTGAWVSVVVILFVVIVVLAWILFAVPTPAEAPTIADTITTTTTPSEDEPLHAQVSVTAPRENATVSKSFTVRGRAPGPWYFEASFPVQVRDKSGNLLASTHADAQTDWMTTDLIPFEAVVNITESYAGPAILVLLRDNPSGLPENDDALEVPIVIQ